jgi:hypothetical protein
MVGGEDVADDFEGVEALRAPEDAEDDVVELRGGTQEQATLDGPAGRLDEAAAFWDEAKFSTHAQKKVGKPTPILALLPKLSSAEGLR